MDGRIRKGFKPAKGLSPLKSLKASFKTFSLPKLQVEKVTLQTFRPEFPLMSTVDHRHSSPNIFIKRKANGNPLSHIVRLRNSPKPRNPSPPVHPSEPGKTLTLNQISQSTMTLTRQSYSTLSWHHPTINSESEINPKSPRYKGYFVMKVQIPSISINWRQAHPTLQSD